MTMYPCPGCGKSRVDLEARCEACGWAPDEVRTEPPEKTVVPANSQLIYAAVVIVGAADLILGILLGVMARISMDVGAGGFASGYLTLYLWIFFAAFLLGQAGLIQIWTVFGSQSILFRSLVGFACLVGLFFMPVIVVTGIETQSMRVFQAAAILAARLPLYALGAQSFLWVFRLAANARIESLDAPARSRIQFGVRQLLSITAVVAIAFGLARWSSSASSMRFGLGLAFGREMLVWEVLRCVLFSVWMVLTVLPVAYMAMCMRAGTGIALSLLHSFVVAAIWIVFTRTPADQAAILQYLVVLIQSIVVYSGLRLALVAGYRFRRG